MFPPRVEPRASSLEPRAPWIRARHRRFDVLAIPQDRNDCEDLSASAAVSPSSLCAVRVTLIVLFFFRWMHALGCFPFISACACFPPPRLGKQGPVPFAWQGERGSSKHDSVVRAARARACIALRHACKEQSFSPASAAAVAAATTARDEDQDASAGGSREASPGAADVGDGSGVIKKLFPLVLSLAGTTVEGARCLCALFAGRGGVGEVARAQVFRPPGASGSGEAVSSRIRAVVCLLVRIEWV